MLEESSQLDAPTLQGEPEERTVPATLSASPANQLPMRLGRYELIEEIARGGMGIVYRALQLDLNRLVAVKMIINGAFADCADVQRFQAEAESAAKLDHPGIVPIYEVGEFHGQPFFSMALIEGKCLASLLTQNPIEANRAAALIAGVADAIDYAHQQGIIHRDLKPANVLISKCGRPRVTDFGVAKQHLGDCDLTVEGELIGTPNFMSPEQARGEDVTFASDVYSLGAILYTALTGRPPFQSANQLDTLHQVVHEDVLPPRRLNSQIPQDLETITLKCLQKKPEHRYQMASTLSAELRRFLTGEPILTCPPNFLQRACKSIRSHFLVASISGVTTVLMVAGLVGLAWRCNYEQRRNQELSQELGRLQARVDSHHVQDERHVFERTRLYRKWQCEYSEKLALYAQKQWRMKNRKLALLLAAEAAECAVAESGEPERPMAPVVRTTIEQMLRVTLQNPEELTDQLSADDLVLLAKQHAGRPLTVAERDAYLAEMEEL